MPTSTKKAIFNTGFAILAIRRINPMNIASKIIPAPICDKGMPRVLNPE